MNEPGIKYQLKIASSEDIYLHLKECNSDFIPPLDQKVDLHEYSKKISEKAITFEAWENKILIGLVAGYFNDIEKKIGYITNVSVIKNWKGKGIALALMSQCIEYAKKYSFNEIDLEVSSQNIGALELYRKVKFVEFEKKNDMVFMKLKIND